MPVEDPLFQRVPRARELGRPEKIPLRPSMSMASREAVKVEELIRGGSGVAPPGFMASGDGRGLIREPEILGRKGPHESEFVMLDVQVEADLDVLLAPGLSRVPRRCTFSAEAVVAVRATVATLASRPSPSRLLQVRIRARARVIPRPSQVRITEERTLTGEVESKPPGCGSSSRSRKRQRLEVGRASKQAHSRQHERASGNARSEPSGIRHSRGAGAAIGLGAGRGQGCPCLGFGGGGGITVTVVVEVGAAQGVQPRGSPAWAGGTDDGGPLGATHCRRRPGPSGAAEPVAR